MRFRGKPNQKQKTAPKGGRKYLTRIGIGLVVAAGISYVFILPKFHLRVDGLVDGDVIPVGPLFRAQITDVLVPCHVSVKRNQPLAIVSNFLLESGYAETYKNHEEAIKLVEVEQAEGMAMAMQEAQSARQNYEAALSNEQKLSALSKAYDDLYRENAIGQMAWQSAKLDWQRAISDTAALRAIWEKAELGVQDLQKNSSIKIRSLKDQLGLVGHTEKQVSTQPLLSPASGQLLDCQARPHEVVDAGTPIYHLFDPQRAYVMAFVDPSDAGGIAAGTLATIQIPGIAQPVTGKVIAVTMETGRLPEPLTRYFWQHNQWMQYRPIKIAFDGLTPEMLDKITFGARVEVDMPVNSWEQKPEASR